MNENMKKTLSECIDLLELIKSDFMWQISYMQQFAALAYSATGKHYDKERLLEIKKVIFTNTGVFSTFRSQWFFTAVVLDNYYDDPEDAFRRMLSTYQEMKEEKVSPYTYMIITDHIITSHAGSGSKRDLVRKTREMYFSMKKYHPLITSWEDYPLAALLATTRSGASDSIENIEACYLRLNELGLPKGNGIQLLSHILCLSDEDAEFKCNRAFDIYDELRQNGIRLYTTYYGALGVLALLGKNTGETVETVLEIVEQFRKTRYFKWLGKGMHVLFASMVMAKGIADQTSAAVTGVTLDILIQAQTAAIVAASAAATAAAASSSS